MMDKVTKNILNEKSPTPRFSVGDLVHIYKGEIRWHPIEKLFINKTVNYLIEGVWYREDELNTDVVTLPQLTKINEGISNFIKVLILNLSNGMTLDLTEIGINVYFEVKVYSDLIVKFNIDTISKNNDSILFNCTTKVKEYVTGVKVITSSELISSGVNFSIYGVDPSSLPKWLYDGLTILNQ